MLPRSWAVMYSEDEENASEGRKQYLRDNRDKVSWLYEPPSWWDEDDDADSILLGNLDSDDEEDDDEDDDEEDGEDDEEAEKELIETVTKMFPDVPQEEAIQLFLESVLENCSTEELFALSGLQTFWINRLTD